MDVHSSKIHYVCAFLPSSVWGGFSFVVMAFPKYFQLWFSLNTRVQYLLSLFVCKYSHVLLAVGKSHLWSLFLRSEKYKKI